MSSSRCPLPVIVFLALSVGQGAAGDTVRPVAISTRSFSAPLVDAQGRTSFSVGNPPRLVAEEELGEFSTATAVVDVMSPGIYTERQLGVVERVASPSDQPPGLEVGVTYGTFSQVLMNDRGDIQFTAALQGPSVSGVNNEAIFAVDSDGIARLVFRESQELLAPGSGGESANYRFLPGNLPSLDGQGGVTFAAFPTTPGTSATRILQEQSGHIEVVNDEVSVPTMTIPTRDDPPLPTLLEVTTMNINAVSSASNGNVVFRAFLVPPPDSNTEFQATNAIIRSHADGTLSSVVSAGTQIDGATISSIFRPVMNAGGDIASVIGLAGSPSTRGILRASDGQLSWVARASDIAPASEPGISFTSFDGFIDLNEAGDLLFRAALAVPGSTSDQAGLFVGQSDGETVAIVRNGEHAPGTESLALFTSLQRSDATINNAGQVAFHAQLSNVPHQRDLGIWATDRYGNLQLIVREGDMLDVSDVGAPADLRTVLALSLYAGGANGTAHGTSFNDRGQIAFAARFTDGTSGIFVSNAVAIPEPATVAILLLGIAAAIGLRKPSHRN